MRKETQKREAEIRSNVATVPVELRHLDHDAKLKPGETLQSRDSVETRQKPAQYGRSASAG